MARARFQVGCLKKEPRRSGPVWVYRFYVDRESDGKRVERNCVIATLRECPSKSGAWKRVHDQDIQTEVNKPNYRGPKVLFGALAEEFENRQLCDDQQERSHTTVYTYKTYLRLYIRPQWDNRIATKIEGWQIEDWLKEIKRDNHLAFKTVMHIKQLMGQVFKYGARRKMIPKICYPIDEVQLRSSDQEFEARVITPEQARAIFEQLRAPENILLLLTAVTGLRCGEVLGLKWEDIDASAQKIFVRRSWTMDQAGKPKSKASKAPVPCIPALADYLAAWRKESPYAGDGDWVFPSFKNKGRTPRSGSSLNTDYIKAAAIRANVIKQGDKRPFGLHVLRHSLATSLISWGLDVKTVQGLLRHSNSQTTLDIYTQSVDKHRLAAQELMMAAVMKPASEMVQ